MPSFASLARPAEWVFATLVLVWLSEAHGRLRDELSDRDLVHAFFGVCLLLLARRRGELRAVFAAGWPLLLPVLVAALSPAWSLDPQESLRAAVSLEASTAFGLWLALRFGAAEQLRLVAASLALATAGSALMIALVPEYGVMSRAHPGAWTGLFIHKNVFARYLVLTVLACGLLARTPGRPHAWAAASALLALAMLLPARSVGGSATLALAAVATGLVVGLGRLSPRARWRAALGIGSLLALAAALALAQLPDLLALVGRDVTLTRRTEIWGLLVAPLREHLWLGHGFAAFWHVAPAHQLVIRTLRFDPLRAHNGLLDLTLELGLVGLVAFLIPFALASARAVRLALAERGAAAAWPLAFLAWWLASNLPESALLDGRRLGWAVFVALAVTLARERTAAARSPA